MPRQWTQGSWPLPRWLTPTRATQLLIVVAVAVVYGRCLGNAFVYDDNVLLVGNPVYEQFDLGGIFLGLGNGVEYFPLQDLVSATDYALWGENPAGWHLTNLILFAAATLAVFHFALRLARRLPVGLEDRALRLATLTALVWALHPLRAQAVAWATQRNTLLAALFFFVGLAAYTDHLAGGPRARRAYVLSLVCYACALLSKSTAIVAPAAQGVLLVAAGYGRSRRHWLGLAPFVALAGAAVVGQSLVAAEVGIVASNRIVVGGSTLGKDLVVALQIPWFYLGKLAAPIGLAVEYDVAFTERLASAPALLALAGLVAVTLGLWRARRRVPAVLIGWLLLGIALPPVLHLVPSATVVADRYFMLPAFGASFALAALIVRWGRAPGAAVAVVVLSGWGVLGGWQGATYRDDVALWSAAAEVTPTHWKVLDSLASARWQGKDLAGLARMADRIEEAHPRSAGPGYWRARVAMAEGRWAEAAKHLEQGAAKDPAEARIAVLEGVLAERTGRLQAAAEAYDEALTGPGAARLSPRQQREARAGLARAQAAFATELGPLEARVAGAPQDPSARAQLAIALDRAALRERAAEQYRELASRGFDNWQVEHNLGNVLKRLGRRDEAIAAYRRALELGSRNPDTLNNLGLLLADADDLEGAQAAFRRAMEIGPRHGLSAYNLGALLARGGDAAGARSAFAEAVRRSPDLRAVVEQVQKDAGLTD